MRTHEAEGWHWCLRCRRCYPLDECRHVGDIDYCAYAGCGDEVWLDSWIWAAVRTLHPGFPVVPVRGQVYLDTLLVDA